MEYEGGFLTNDRKSEINFKSNINTKLFTSNEKNSSLKNNLSKSVLWKDINSVD